ncbi:Similar to NETO2: Neuropilin and tolloid-like protein 2 (Homo sapiens) [Cotesia congregata]|uniref:Similar to NETO2: Neuropilin and tolloid-like protein 2 (Homo sapiens) n=1 Tax=Cotesia congregata TaxID=51543 RepID=A0A8J2MSZ3_COTCN|nr:Similar to NETO2: Neuropilin and tolloid-like protein 2 (Homo sapiens) [Cotesia congregata]
MVFVVIFSLKGEKQAIRQSFGASKPSVSAGFSTEISPGFLLLTAHEAQCTLLSREDSISGCTPTKGKTNPYDQSQLNNSTINFHVVRRECTTTDKGMLIKLDFRDYFELEAPMPTNDKELECAFDYLEVRDGYYGFSTPVGNYCDKNFPPEITSRSRYLWLHFHSDDTIEYKGFKAIWSQVPRPTYLGVPAEPEPCIKYVTEQADAEINDTLIGEERKIAQKNNVPLDCLWIIRAKEKWRIQMTFEYFKLEKPNDCDANFLSIFDKKTEMNSLVKNFCGSIAETVNTKSNVMYMRFYLEIKAINSSFKSLMTAIRDKEPNVQSCEDDEYDCDDATCIAGHLRCNKRENCRLKWDEDVSICGVSYFMILINNTTLPSKSSIAFDSTRIIIILVIFSLIMFGMCFSFIFNCVRKLHRDHRIIKLKRVNTLLQEHIRMSRENRLDEIGRKATPCPLSQSQTDIRQRDSESPSLEIEPSKELVTGATLIAHDYTTKEHVLEMNYAGVEINDIHQSNNMSNATQERLQESNEEEPEMCDSSCQTRESLFDPRISDPRVSPGFSTFGYRSGSSQNGVGTSASRKPSQGQLSSQSPKQSLSSTPRTRFASEPCSICNSDSRGHVTNGIICSRHNTPIPAPPGWSFHEHESYSPPIQSTELAAESEYPSYHRYQSPKPERAPPGFKEPILSRQATIGSGERYGSLYGSGRGSSNPTNSSSQHSDTPKCPLSDPRYRAEAIIEIDQKRPFSIESTKSAPDVIATH